MGIGTCMDHVRVDKKYQKLCLSLLHTKTHNYHDAFWTGTW